MLRGRELVTLGPEKKTIHSKIQSVILLSYIENQFEKRLFELGKPLVWAKEQLNYPFVARYQGDGQV